MDSQSTTPYPPSNTGTNPGMPEPQKTDSADVPPPYSPPPGGAYPPPMQGYPPQPGMAYPPQPGMGKWKPILPCDDGILIVKRNLISPRNLRNMIGA